MAFVVDLAPKPARKGWGTKIEPEWAFDLLAIEDAARELGVTAPVVFGPVEYANGRWGGMHTMRDGEHRISIKRTLTAAQASRTMWHELSHAAQHDRGVRGGTAQLRKRAGDDAYMNDPREVEARAAEANHERYALVVP